MIISSKHPWFSRGYGHPAADAQLEAGAGLSPPGPAVGLALPGSPSGSAAPAPC